MTDKTRHYRRDYFAVGFYNMLESVPIKAWQIGQSSFIQRKPGRSQKKL